jgi:F0F1-type ATP synthase delta subunit
LRDTTVAARYAKALFLVTEKRSETATALEHVKSLVPLLQPGSRIADLLADPRMPLADKRGIV